MVDFFVDTSGVKWLFNSKGLHRTDGPAVIYPDGYLGKPSGACDRWFINNTPLTEELFNTITQGSIEDLPKYLGMGFDTYISERLGSDG